MLESYTLLWNVLHALKEGHELPPLFQKYAQGYAGDLRYFISLDTLTSGGLLADKCQRFYAQDGITRYVGAMVQLTHLLLVLLFEFLHIHMY
jgi:hypothetical protein